jgi:hypothetical protein
MPFAATFDPKEYKDKRFGTLVGQGIEKNINSVRCFLFKCDCGAESWRATHRLKAMGKNSGCDTCRKKFVKGYQRQRKILSESKNWKGKGSIPGRMLTLLIIAAKARNISVEINISDLDELWTKQNGKCALTGRILNLSGNLNGKLIVGTASVDRIDSSKGYTKENIQWVHKDINMAKRALNNKEFISLCKEVANNNE